MSVGFNNTSIDLIELPPNLPNGMPLAIDDCSLAFHLGFRNKVLWYVLENTTKHYKVIRIPKKTKGVRIIHDPSPMMKLMLQQAHVKFLAPLQSKLGSHVTAYRKGVSARMAVAQHVPKCPICDAAPKGKTASKHDCPRRGLYIHMDLKDFFPSTSKAWVRNYFKEWVGYSHSVSGYLASLMTVRDIPNPKYRAHLVKPDVYNPEFYAGVPQGSPASGAICNLVANVRLDTLMLAYIDQLNKEYQLDGEWKWRYSRYSDDMTFTCGLNPDAPEREKILEHLKDLVKQSGYTLNNKKTRIAHSYYRKTLLGMVFNDKPNYAKEEYLKLRAIVHNCRVNGFETQFKRAGQLNAGAMITWLRGKVNWVYQINPQKGSKLLVEFKDALTVHEGEPHEHAAG